VKQHSARSIGLIVTSDETLAEHLVRELRALDWIAVPVDSCDTALEMMGVVEFSLVIADVAGTADWLVCRRLAESTRSPVAIITSFLADDRRYRRAAFEMGVVAYVGRPCARRRFREMLCRVEQGERYIELVARVVRGVSGADRST